MAPVKITPATVDVCEGLTSAKFGLTRRWLRQAAPKCGLTVLSHTVSHGAKMIFVSRHTWAARRGRQPMESRNEDPRFCYFCSTVVYLGAGDFSWCTCIKSARGAMAPGPPPPGHACPPLAPALPPHSLIMSCSSSLLTAWGFSVSVDVARCCSARTILDSIPQQACWWF